MTITRHETVDGDHGRIETRRVTVFANIEGLRERHDWPGLRSLIMVESTREIDGKRQSEARYYIASFEPEAKQAAAAVRSHWLIENALHWRLDVHFCDDDCRVRKDNAPANFLVMRHAAYNLIRRGPGKTHSAYNTRSLPGTTTTSSDSSRTKSLNPIPLIFSRRVF